MGHTICFIVPVRTGALAVSVLGVLAAGAFGLVYAIEIESGMMSTPHDLPAARFVPFISMASWMVLALISLFGCVVSWTAKPRLVSSYFWAFLVHYILDLGFLVVTLFFCIKTSQSATVPCGTATTANAAAASNSSGGLSVRDGGAPGQCAMPLSVGNIAVLVILVLYKVLSTFFIYVLFTFRRWAEKRALEKEAQKIMQQRPPQQWINYDADTTKNWSKFDD